MLSLYKVFDCVTKEFLHHISNIQFKLFTKLRLISVNSIQALLFVACRIYVIPLNINYLFFEESQDETGIIATIISKLFDS